MIRTIILNVVGLTRSLVARGMPSLKALLSASADIQTIMPALTCPVQATYLTGRLPSEHGIVGNGWYFRSLSEVMFWKQSNRLIQGEKIWHEGKRRKASFTCASTGWWFAMATDADYVITPRPVYCSDGRKIPDCYTIPAELRQEFNSKLGQFPLFQFWGPGASIKSSEWLSKAAISIEEQFRPTLQLVYLPHLDYALQKEGPSGNILKDLLEVDTLCGKLVDFFQNRGCRVVVLSEYGITDVTRPIHPNRLLRSLGHVKIKVDLGREYLDTYGSRAFAVSDHQIAHIYINEKRLTPEIAEYFSHVPGVDKVLDEDGKRAHRLDHQRAGDLVLVSEKDSWFTYYYWEDDSLAPDFARTVNIHAKPGYDPCELFFDPAIAFPKLRVAMSLLKKTLGFRYLMNVIPLDAKLIKGSHGRPTEMADEGPLFMTTEPGLLTKNKIDAEQVYGLILDHIFADPEAYGLPPRLP